MEFSYNCEVKNISLCIKIEVGLPYCFKTITCLRQLLTLSRWEESAVQRVRTISIEDNVLKNKNLRKQKQKKSNKLSFIFEKNHFKIIKETRWMEFIDSKNFHERIKNLKSTVH